RLVSDHPTRFGGFATLPLPDGQGALREPENALDTLRLAGGVLLASQHERRVLGDPAFSALFRGLGRPHAVVFVPPTIPQSRETLPIDVPGFAAEFTFDTSRAILNLIWSGTAERCRNVRLIFSHAGGTAPFLAWRWSLLDFLPGTLERAPHGVMHYLKSFFYDVALSAHPHALRSLCELVPPTQILFGTDFPFAPEPVTRLTIDGVTRYGGFDEAARGAIERDNVLSLLGRLRDRVEGGGHA